MVQVCRYMDMQDNMLIRQIHMGSLVDRYVCRCKGKCEVL